MRVVLDTNVVMSAIFFGGVPFEVLTPRLLCNRLQDS